MRSPWIYDAGRDLPLIVLTPLLILPVTALALTRFSIEQFNFVVLAFGATGHHLPGLLRAYGDRELFERFRTRFIVAPIVLLTMCVYLALTDLPALKFIVVTWGVWHGLAQVYGFSRIYEAKSGTPSRVGALLDRAMCIAWFVGGVLLSERLLGILEFFWSTGGPLVTAELIRDVRWVWSGGLVAVTVAWLAHMALRWRRGAPPSLVKTLFMASSFGFWFACMVGFESVILGVAMFEVFHDVQYLAIVWLYNTKRVSQGGRFAGFTRFLFQRSGALVGLYVGLVFAYGAVFMGGREVFSGTTLAPLMTAVISFSALLHFYYDAFIWSVSDGETRKTLGLEASASVERWRAPAWSGHAARWGYLAVPLAVLTLLSGSAGTRMDRYREVVQAFPGVAKAHFAFGTELVNAGFPGRAEDSFRRALELQPDYAEARAGLGQVAFLRRAFFQAQREFEAALAMDLDCAVAWLGMGALHLERGDEASARDAFERARALDPELKYVDTLDRRLRERAAQL